jgi:hypothetical protein
LFSESAGVSDYLFQLIGCATDDLGCVVSVRNVVEGLLDTGQVADDVLEGFGGSGFPSVDGVALCEQRSDDVDHDGSLAVVECVRGGWKFVR